MEQKQEWASLISLEAFETLIRRIVREELERFFPDRSSPWPSYVAQPVQDHDG